MLTPFRRLTAACNWPGKKATDAGLVEETAKITSLLKDAKRKNYIVAFCLLQGAKRGFPAERPSRASLPFTEP
jgi:hypothetical protein